MNCLTQIICKIIIIIYHEEGILLFPIIIPFFFFLNLLRVSIQIPEISHEKLKVGMNFVENTQVAPPQFLLPDLRMKSPLLYIDTITSSKRNKALCRRDLLSLEYKFQKTNTLDTLYYCLLPLVFRVLFFFSCMIPSKVMLVYIFFHTFFSFFGNLLDAVLFRMFCRKGIYTIYNS